ncbi:MAG TPA: hypothetical protein DHW65_10500 [Dehalococcoidia bacterium]|nr:hypothetical protein [Dehalococcoidia bacterium]
MPDVKRVTSDVWAGSDTRGCSFGSVITGDGIVIIDSHHKSATAMRQKSGIAKRGPLRYIINAGSDN